MLTERKNRTAEVLALVNHGKTTLGGGMLKQVRVFRDNRPVAERT